MTCPEARTLLHAYVDGELDLARSLEVEAHLNSCSACATELANLRALRAGFRGSALYHPAPAQLERKVRAALRDARRAEGRTRFLSTRYAWTGTAAAAAAILLVMIAVGGFPPFSPHTSDLTAREVVDDHLRSLAGNHLTDVLSSNQHTVKPWFDGRLDFTPPVQDFAAQGFPLIGGRLDYLNNRPVAAVIYRRRLHFINLFISPAEHAADAPPHSQAEDGYNIVHWTKSGMSYWAVSSVSASELETFAQLVSAGNPAPSPAHG
jgi:anti-sigma factor RsiW